MRDLTAWEKANRTDAARLRTLIQNEEQDEPVCPFCGSEGSLHSYPDGGFHCFGACGGPNGRTFTNTEVVAKAQGVSFDEARSLILHLD